MALISVSILYTAFLSGRIHFATQGISSPITGLSLSGVAAAVAPAEDSVLRSAVLPVTMVAKHEVEASLAPLLAPLQVPLEESELSTAAFPEVVEPEPPEPPFFIYTVQEGDTVGDLAAHFGIAPESILWNNLDLEDEDFLSVGQKIRIPTSDGIIYEVRLGDTLSDIAGYFGVDVQDILDFPANGLTNVDDIVENQTVFVPNGVFPAPVHPEPAAEEEAPSPIVEPTDAPAPPPVVERPSSSTGFIWPAVGRISSYFGPSHPLGIDIDQFHSPGAPVVASAAGTVIFAGGNPCCSYGLYVVIDHGNGFETLYAHLGSITVVQGQQVAQGEVIGYVGLTGYTTGYHLHFEVHLNGQYVNPLNYLP